MSNVTNPQTDHPRAIVKSDAHTLKQSIDLRQVQRGASYTLGIATVLVCLCALLLSVYAGLGLSVAATMLLLWLCISVLLWRALPYHPHSHFGMANVVTCGRAAGAAVLAGFIPIASLLTTPTNTPLLWAITAGAIMLLSLDGLDGYLARKTGLCSDMGARFDMEIDALLALIIAMLIWRSNELASWILGLGVLRYVYVVAGFWYQPLTAPLYPSLRRKTVCVLQLAALCAIISPLIKPPVSVAIGLFALLCLAASFARDIHWLVTHDRLPRNNNTLP